MRLSIFIAISAMDSARRLPQYQKQRYLLLKRRHPRWTEAPLKPVCDPRFLKRDWQKNPRLFRSALPEAMQCIDALTLLDMAQAEECESRLVVTDRAQKNWHSVDGPFAALQLKKAQRHPWTLLIQAVDQWIPEVARLRDRFDFLPRWRLDDVMISLASEGGGVGPHFDYYDVFLIQASGERRWQIGQRCNERSALRPQADMRLLKTFQQKEEYALAPGDMIYIPAGMAHWGTALKDDCITISIGFRAPSQRELVMGMAEQLRDATQEQLRYRDSSTSLKADPFCINDAAIKNAEQLWQQLSPAVRRQAIARALGSYATEPRYPDYVQPAVRLWTESSLKARLGKKDPFVLRPASASRVAYRATTKNQAELYLNGEVHVCSLTLAKALCHQKPLQSLRAADMALVINLLNDGKLEMLP